MRFLHTSDWHLGRTLCHANLLDDQAHALDQLLAMLKDTRAQALLVAGDLFDRPAPPPEALSLFRQTVEKVTAVLGVPVLALGGDQDSSDRPGFASRFLGLADLHLAGGTDPVILDGTAFHLLPWVPRSPAPGPGEAVKAQLARARACHPAGHRFVAVAHVFAEGGDPCDSEADLGPNMKIDPSLFKSCDYAALGHLHRPQEAGFPHIRYAGSLLKYSASEADQAKGALLVELPAAGAARIEFLPLRPRHDLRILRGSLESLMAGSAGSTDDYCFVELPDEESVEEALPRLRQIYPHLLGLLPAPAPGLALAPEELDPEALFRQFFRDCHGRELEEDESALFREIARRDLPAESLP